jgi:peptidoglycan/LPS O-acetylase OafA/YrhL
LSTAVDVSIKPSVVVPTQRSAVAPVESSAPAGRPQPSGRLAVVDGLRLVAALTVLAFHYTYLSAEPWGRPANVVFHRVSRVTAYGWLGVYLFFVISGFVICLSAWGRGLGRFFVSRVVRLFPAYWFAVLATAAAVFLLTPGHPRPPATHVLVNLTMLQAPMQVPDVDGSYWTLWEELHFYLLFAVVVWRGLTYRRTVLFCLLWAVASVVATASPDRVLHYAVGDATAPFFVAGIAFFLMYRFGPNLLLWGVVGASWALGLHRLTPMVASVGSHRGQPLSWAAVIVIVTGIFAVMAAVALEWLSWIRGAWLTTAGALTYPLYLLHQVIGATLIARLHDRVSRWPLLVGLTAAMLVAAWLVHRFVERPLAPVIRRRLTDALIQVRSGDAAG